MTCKFSLRQPYRTLIVIAAACFALTLPANAQEKPTPPETPAPAAAPANPASSANPASFTYDVVSIKPVSVGMSFRMSVNFTPDGLTFRAFTVADFVRNAFPISTPDQLVGLPDWADARGGAADRFDLDAKMDEQTADAYKMLSRDQQQEARAAMMIALLADRCKLKYHKEIRELPIYNLVIAKNGPKFKETPADSTGKRNFLWGEISGDNIEIKTLLQILSGNARRVVVDKTGLTGKYTLSLKWNPLESENLPQSFLDQYPDFKNRPGLIDAVQEQLGLKLEPAKGPVDVYVIDQIEKPSEN